ncbi:unnamed protein product, partial [Iphiclides podalirius]
MGDVEQEAGGDVHEDQYLDQHGAQSAAPAVLAPGKPRRPQASVHIKLEEVVSDNKAKVKALTGPSLAVDGCCSGHGEPVYAVGAPHLVQRQLHSASFAPGPRHRPTSTSPHHHATRTPPSLTQSADAGCTGVRDNGQLNYGMGPRLPTRCARGAWQHLRH